MEFFQRDRRMLYAIIAIAIIFSLAGYFSDVTMIAALLKSIPAVFIAITFHEYAHAFAAYKLGDDTAKEQGRLTLNPFKHTDPLGLLMLVFVGFGWGKPVQVDSRNLNRNISVNKATAIISFAGPAANFILAIIFSIITALLLKFNLLGNMNIRAATTIIEILEYIVSINIGLGVFNLIPLPPLDGSKILSSFLPYNARQWFEEKEMIFYIAFLVLWISGMAGTLIAPAIRNIYEGLFKLVFTIFGI